MVTLPLGQTETHDSQPRHSTRSPVPLALSSSMVMMLLGQVLAHSPQPSQVSSLMLMMNTVLAPLLVARAIQRPRQTHDIIAQLTRVRARPLPPPAPRPRR